jgi:hypothetical protein
MRLVTYYCQSGRLLNSSGNSVFGQPLKFLKLIRRNFEQGLDESVIVIKSNIYNQFDYLFFQVLGVRIFEGDAILCVWIRLRVIDGAIFVVYDYACTEKS